MSTSYNSKHKQKERVVAQFMNFTQSNEKSAINFLAQHEWKLDLAVDAYYLSLDGSGGGARRDSARGAGTNSQLDRKKLDQIWTLYRDQTVQEKMTQDGVCKFLQDLHFKLDDKIVLVLAWKFKAQIQGEFTKEEFYNAMNDLG